MLDSYSVEVMASAAEEATEMGRELRARLARTVDPTNSRRQEDLDIAVDRIRETMRPVRRAMGQMPFLRLEPGVEQRLRKASDEAQRERRRLRKMLGKGTKTKV